MCGPDVLEMGSIISGAVGCLVFSLENPGSIYPPPLLLTKIFRSKSGVFPGTQEGWGRGARAGAAQCGS